MATSLRLNERPLPCRVDDQLSARTRRTNDDEDHPAAVEALADESLRRAKAMRAGRVCVP